MSMGAYDVARATPQVRGEFLQKVAAWTFAGLFITAIVAVLSAVFVVPMVAGFGKFAIIIAIYGSFFFAQSVARNMVYGESKMIGFAIGNAAQGLAFGFLLAMVAFSAGATDGLRIIGSCLFITLASAAGMLAYVTTFKSNFTMLGSALSMLTFPMLALIVIQLVFPVGGTLGLIISIGFLAISVGALLYKLNQIVHGFDSRQTVEGGYELSLSIVLVLWNLISLMSRARNG